MMAKPHLSPWVRLTLSVLALALLAAPASAQVAKPGNDVLSSLVFVHDKLNAADQIEPLDNVRSVLAKSLENGWEAFRIGLPAHAEWSAAIDKRTGLVTFAEGGNVPWVPGRGNSLTDRDLAGFLKAKPRVDLGVMDSIARDFLPRVEALLGVDPAQLVLDRARSGQPASHVWFVDYDVVRDGLVVEGARVVFRVNNGNLIQYGSENLPVAGAPVPATRLTASQARAAVARYIGGFQAGDALRDAGSLHLLPSAILSARTADGYDFGNGRGLTKVWRVAFKRPGVMGSWTAQVDAATGELLSFDDANKYVQALVSGGVYLNSPATGGEVERPFPDVGLSSGGFSNGGGLYNYTGGTVTGTLSGQFVKITDSCGAISQTSDAAGNIDFGTSTGTDCTTPGHGGAGNTHSAREQFYQIEKIKGVVRGWLPSNTWINTQLNVKVNLNQTCNAYWDGTALNFFKSGGGCANTGQIAGVSLHEFGHGVDQNDGTGTATDGATGESYGDTTALIALHDSCLGEGFLSSNCAGYGDACTACTGVRDADWNKHASHTAATADNFIRVHCPAASGGAGPCGKEVHCESYVPTETMWDLAARDLPGAGTGVAWTLLDRLWYLSRNTATKSFSCTAGTTYTSNGCSAGSLWKVFRAIDDDNGNLNDGTPHGGALFAAFNRHGIACATDAGASTTFAGCTPPAAPTLSATAGTNVDSLAWTASGTAVYDVFRNDVGCNAGFTKIANAATGTSLTDPAVANGFTYYYQVTALPSGNESCASLPSNCVAATPVASTDFSLAAAPTALSIAKGSAGSSTITTFISGAFNNAVFLSATGMPAGVTVSFSPAAIAAPGAGSATMTITVASTAAAGTSTITITGTGGTTAHTATLTLTVTGTVSQLLGNPGFENGSASPAPWTVTAGVVDSSTGEAAHSGSWKAWMDGYGTAHTDSILQTVTIPATATLATLSFWLHIDTAETTTTTPFDTLKVQIRNTSGTVLSTLATYSNLNKNTGFAQKSFDITSFRGQTIQIFLIAIENGSLQTSFVVDDFAVNIQ